MAFVLPKSVCYCLYLYCDVAVGTWWMNNFIRAEKPRAITITHNDAADRGDTRYDCGSRIILAGYLQSVEP